MWQDLFNRALIRCTCVLGYTGDLAIALDHSSVGVSGASNESYSCKCVCLNFLQSHNVFGTMSTYIFLFNKQFSL